MIGLQVNCATVIREYSCLSNICILQRYKAISLVFSLAIAILIIYVLNLFAMFVWYTLMRIRMFDFCLLRKYVVHTTSQRFILVVFSVVEIYNLWFYVRTFVSEKFSQESYWFLWLVLVPSLIFLFFHVLLRYKMTLIDCNIISIDFPIGKIFSIWNIYLHSYTIL